MNGLVLRRWLAGLAALAWITVTGCDPPSDPPPGTTTTDTHSAQIFTEDDDGTEIDLAIGDQFEYSYKWAGNAAFVVELGSFDHAVIERVDEHVDSSPPAGCQDCPSTLHWVFEALAAGQTTLQIEYVAHDGSPIRTVGFPVTVIE